MYIRERSGWIIIGKTFNIFYVLVRKLTRAEISNITVAQAIHQRCCFFCVIRSDIRKHRWCAALSWETQQHPEDIGILRLQGLRPIIARHHMQFTDFLYVFVISQNPVTTYPKRLNLCTTFRTTPPSTTGGTWLGIRLSALNMRISLSHCISTHAPPSMAHNRIAIC